MAAGQTIGGAQGYLEGRAVFARDHQHPAGERGERRRVEPHRRAQHDATEPVGVVRREPGDISRDLGRDMRSPDAEMREQRE